MTIDVINVIQLSLCVLSCSKNGVHRDHIELCCEKSLELFQQTHAAKQNPCRRLLVQRGPNS